MNRKMYWGVAILILLIGTAAVFMLTRTTETEPKTVYNPLTEAEKKQVEQNIPDAIDKEKQNLPPIIAEGDKQQVDDPIAEVSDETNDQTSKETDLSKYEGKPLDEDFFRNNYSREAIKSMIELDKEINERIRTVDIPFHEKIRARYLKLLQVQSDNEYGKRGLSESEAEIQRFKLINKNGEELNRLMSNVLNEEDDNVEE